MKPPFYGKGSLLVLWCAVAAWDVSWLAYEATQRKWVFVALFAVLAAWAVLGLARTGFQIGKQGREMDVDIRAHAPFASAEEIVTMRLNDTDFVKTADGSWSAI